MKIVVMGLRVARQVMGIAERVRFLCMSPAEQAAHVRKLTEDALARYALHGHAR